MSDKGITLEGLAAAVDALRQELATWKALAHKQDQLSADQITATQSGATAAKISQIAVNTAAIQSLAAQVAGQISLEYVTTLPATGEPLTLYLVPQGDGTAPNFCNEYLWVNNAWELIGTTGAMANNGELTIQVNGVAVGTFTANQAANGAINITVPTNTNQLVNGAQYVDAAALQTALALKQNSLNTAQLDAVNSGITAAAVQQIADNATAISGKQDALTVAQQAAVNSGATVAKIDQIAANASAIVSLTSSKQDSLSTTQLAAVNSGITSAAVQQISTNADNISALGTAVASKASDNAVVHLAGAETISGDKTWTGLNTFQYTVVFKDAAAVSAGGYGVGLNFFDYEGNRYGYIQPHIMSDGTKNIVFGNSASGYLEFASSLLPYASGAVNLGLSTNQWGSVYAQMYYYNGTEFQNKFVTLDTVQTITGNKTFSGAVLNDGFYEKTQKTAIDVRTNPSTTQSSDTFKIWSGALSNRGDYLGGMSFGQLTDGSLRFQWICFGYPVSGNPYQRRVNLRSYRDGNCAFYPESNNDINLGLSSAKWKSFNGINPGALSFPGASTVDLSGDITDINGGINEFTPSVDGWVQIVVPNAADAYLSVRSYYSPYSGDCVMGNSSTLARLCITVPVRSGIKHGIYVKAASITSAVFRPCLGNV